MVTDPHSSFTDTYRQSGALPQRQSGYTLIELLIVMTVLGILASIGIYSFLQLQNPARDATQQLIGILAQTRTAALANTQAYRVQLAGQTFSAQASVACTDTTGWTTASAVPVTSISSTATYTTTPAGTLAAPVTVACFSSRGLAVTTLPVLVTDTRRHSYTVTTYVGGSVRVVNNAP